MSSKDEEILGLWAELFVGHALAYQAIAKQVQRQSPVTLDEYNLLLEIKRSPSERASLKALADATVYTKSGMTRLVNRMEEEGYVVRQPCPEDGRKTFAAITVKGKEALRQSWKFYQQAILATFSGLYSRDEARVLRTLLARLGHAMGPAPLVQIKKGWH